ncbi:MAG: hypothetical protein ACOC0P_05935, partial [Planctomycetota bacterium]
HERIAYELESAATTDATNVARQLTDGDARGSSGVAADSRASSPDGDDQPPTVLGGGAGTPDKAVVATSSQNVQSSDGDNVTAATAGPTDAPRRWEAMWLNP